MGHAPLLAFDYLGYLKPDVLLLPFVTVGRFAPLRLLRKLRRRGRVSACRRHLNVPTQASQVPYSGLIDPAKVAIFRRTL